MATENRDLNSLRKQQDSLLKSLQGSSSARIGKQPASPSDMAAQQRLLKTYAQIQKIKNKEIQDRWYGGLEEVTQPEGAQAGFFGKALDVLSRPLYGVVGAVDFARGDSGESSLSKAISQNAAISKRTFGDVLKDSNVPGVISAPLGLALDIAFDPINWATVGTAAIIPRVFAGAAKGTAKGGLSQGVKAAAKGIESKVLSTAVTTGRIGAAINPAKIRVPDFLKRKFTKGGGETIAPRSATPAMRRLQEKALKTADEYNELTGVNLINEVSGAGIPLLESRYRIRLGDVVRDVGNKTPFIKNFFKYFDYDSADWMRISQIKDSLTQVSGGGKEMNAGVRALIRNVEDGVDFDEALEIAMKESGIEERLAASTVSPKLNFDNVADDISKKIPEISDDRKVLDEFVEKMQKKLADHAEIVGNPDKFISADHVENMVRLAEEQTGFAITMEDLKEMMNYSHGETGWKWFDTLKRRITSSKHELKFGKRSVEIGKGIENTLDGIQAFISVFKRAKVGGSGTAWTNAVVGNLVMAKMGGIDILDPLFRKKIWETAKLMRGASPQHFFLKEMLESTEVLKVMAYNAGTLRKTTGMTAEFVNAKYLMERLIRVGRDEGLIADNVDIGKLEKSLGYAMGEVDAAMRGLSKGGGPATEDTLRALEKGSQGLKSPTDLRTEALREGKIFDTADAPTSLIGSEFFDSSMANRGFQFIEEKAKAGNTTYKLLDFMFNKMSRGYEKIDQTYKFGTFLHTTVDGVSEASLRVIARNIVLAPEDITKVGGRYRLSGIKSLELANEIYLNYAAMPAAVRVLRSLPLVGFPFASFTYGMGLKTAKTITTNPSIFNKVGFALNEFSGSQSPLEKGVLSDPRFSYLNEPGMVKVPGLGVPSGVGGDRFFEKYGFYVNTAQMIPYLTLNMFTPASRRYKDTFTNNAVQAIDRLPFLKDPWGGVLLDYFILPSVIRDSRPIGTFGQPLYPVDASPLEKFRRAFYQGVIDPITPGILGTVGGVPAGKILPQFLPEKSLDYLPSYRMRQTARASLGQSIIGATGSEGAGSRTIRAILGSLGVPVQAPVSFNYLPKDLEAEVKKAANK